jgi:hypothetical protein
MQASGGLAAECMNLFMSATRTSVETTMTFFVAFHVLGMIDNIYIESIDEVELLEAVEEPLYFKRRPLRFHDVFPNCYCSCCKKQ